MWQILELSLLKNKMGGLKLGVDKPVSCITVATFIYSLYTVSSECMRRAAEVEKKVRGCCEGEHAEAWSGSGEMEAVIRCGDPPPPPTPKWAAKRRRRRCHHGNVNVAVIVGHFASVTVYSRLSVPPVDVWFCQETFHEQQSLGGGLRRWPYNPIISGMCGLLPKREWNCFQKVDIWIFHTAYKPMLFLFFLNLEQWNLN